MDNLWLFDSDTVSEHNLNRLPLSTGMVGRQKSVALARTICELRPTCGVTALGNWSASTADSYALHNSVDWIAVGTDTWRSRREVYAWAASVDGVRYVELAAEGEYGSVTGVPADFVTPDEANPGYASVPVHVGPCVLAASVAAYHILHDHPAPDAVIRMGWKREGGLDARILA